MSQYSLSLTPRDIELFDDIRRFGFTTTEHFMIRFSASYDSCRQRLSRLVRGNYLQTLGSALISGKKIYVPNKKYFRVCKYKETYKFNVFSLEHDRYIQNLYSLFVRHQFGKVIYLEQDMKMANAGAEMFRVPDIILRDQHLNYVFEYERSKKTEEKYDKMNIGLKKMDQDKNIFIFLCETEQIAANIRAKMDLKMLHICRPKAFLECLRSESHRSIEPYYQTQSVKYFDNK